MYSTTALNKLWYFLYFLWGFSFLNKVILVFNFLIELLFCFTALLLCIFSVEYLMYQSSLLSNGCLEFLT